MCDFDPNYTFPASPQRTVFTTVPTPNLLNSESLKQRPLSFSPQTKSRRHAHRRSAAMSEDLSPADVAQLLSPTRGTRSLASSPLPKNELRTDFTIPTFNSQHSDNTPPQEPATEIPFLMSLNPKTPKEVGEPGEIVQSIPIPKPLGVLYPSVSPMKSHSPVKHNNSPLKSPKEKSKKRRSFAKILKRNSANTQQSNGQIISLTPDKEKDDEFTFPLDFSDADATITPNFQPRTPESPKCRDFNLGHRHNHSAFPRLDFESQENEANFPRIDLNEALSCSFEHRPKLNDFMPDSPFTKSPCPIGPVLEEGDEEEELKFSENSDLGRQSSNSSNSSKFSIASPVLTPRTPRNKPTSVYSLPGSPTRLKQEHPSASNTSINTFQHRSQQTNISQANKPAFNHHHEKLMPSVEQVSNLAIMEPKHTALDGTKGSVPNSPTKTKQFSSPAKGLSRKRSLMDKFRR